MQVKAFGNYVVEQLGGGFHQCESTNFLTFKETDEVVWYGLNNNFIDDLTLIVVAAVTAAFSAFLFNCFQSRLEAKKTNHNNLINEYCEVVDEVKCISINYWVADQSKTDKTELIVSEIKLKSLLRVLIRYTDILSSLLEKKKSVLSEDLNKFLIDIFELSTGDGFESNSKESANRKASQIGRICADIQANIRLHGKC